LLLSKVEIFHWYLVNLKRYILVIISCYYLHVFLVLNSCSQWFYLFSAFILF
jgi:hypothetical protein